MKTKNSVTNPLKSLPQGTHHMSVIQCSEFWTKLNRKVFLIQHPINMISVYGNLVLLYLYGFCPCFIKLIALKEIILRIMYAGSACSTLKGQSIGRLNHSLASYSPIQHYQWDLCTWILRACPHPVIARALTFPVGFVEPKTREEADQLWIYEAGMLYLYYAAD